MYSATDSNSSSTMRAIPKEKVERASRNVQNGFMDAYLAVAATVDRG